MTEHSPKEPRCNCPNGSYHVKHTDACYKAQIEWLRKDAERYRWLRKQSPMADITIECCNSSLAGGLCHLSDEDADVAIDAAMEQKS